MCVPNSFPARGLHGFNLWVIAICSRITDRLHWVQLLVNVLKTNYIAWLIMWKLSILYRKVILLECSHVHDDRNKPNLYYIYATFGELFGEISEHITM